jgi:hypothetical protein
MANNTDEYKIVYNDGDKKYNVYHNEELETKFTNADIFYVFKKIFTEFHGHNFYYRGQTKNFKLKPSLIRHENIFNNEDEYYNEIFLEHEIELCDSRNIYEKYAKMQHYGCPTRLLDITSNPFKALGFMIDGIESTKVSADAFGDEGDFLANAPCIFIFDNANCEKIDMTNEEKIINKKINNAFKNKKLPLLIPSKNQSRNLRLFAQEGAFIFFNQKFNDYDSIEETYKIKKIIFIFQNDLEIEVLRLKLSEYNYDLHKLYPDLSKKARYYKNQWKLKM